MRYRLLLAVMAVAGMGHTCMVFDIVRHGHSKRTAILGYRDKEPDIFSLRFVAIVTLCSLGFAVSLTYCIFFVHNSLMVHSPEVKRIYRRVTKKWAQKPKVIYCPELEAVAPGECSICLEPLVNLEEKKNWHETVGLLRFPCKHILHASCADEWLLREANCPLCRAPITSMRDCERLLRKSDMDAAVVASDIESTTPSTAASENGEKAISSSALTPSSLGSIQKEVPCPGHLALDGVQEQNEDVAVVISDNVVDNTERTTPTASRCIALSSLDSIQDQVPGVPREDSHEEDDAGNGKVPAPVVIGQKQIATL